LTWLRGPKAASEVQAIYHGGSFPLHIRSKIIKVLHISTIACGFFLIERQVRQFMLNAAAFRVIKDETFAQIHSRRPAVVAVW
jgi:hypothetical protein